jgi:trk system potassium uptake protein
VQFKAVFRVLGILLTCFSFSMLVPVGVSFYLHDAHIYPYIIAFAVTICTGLILWLPLFHDRSELKIRDGFLIVILFWVVLSAFSALPFIFAFHHDMGFTNSVFESVSGFTTTGVSAFGDLRQMSATMLYYRQQLQFLGGMGIIVLAVAILPMLGVGGMQLYRAETPGPMKDDKITPRIAETAKAIWAVYVGLVIACTLSYWLAGMSVLEALETAFGTISTGGFSTHNTSFIYFHSNLMDIVGIVFMFLGGTNFTLHYLAATRASFKPYWKDVEFRNYLGAAIVVSIIIIVLLALFHVYHSVWGDAVQAVFNIVSIMTTTGFVSSNFTIWPLFIPFLLMILGLIGACGGSTSGGMKIMRVVLLRQQVRREVRKLIHPRAVYPVKLGNRVLSDEVVDAIWAFVAAYVGILILVIVLLMASGIDFESAFGATASALGNVGVGIGKYAFGVAGMNVFSKWVLIFTMIAGRLEVFTLLVLFSRSFWRR